MTGAPSPVFHLAIEDGIAVLTLDLPGSPVNTLGRATAAEFAGHLEALAADPAVRAIVLRSGKEDTFVAGADIEEFTLLRTAAEAEAMSREGQAMIDRVAACPKPVVVAIHGPCLGAGLELSLACTWRLATDHPKTVLGLPEVQIGLLPGAGGCQRLPRLIGVRAALDMILAGKSERAAKAFRIGLVDELVHPAQLRDLALRAADRLARSGPVRRGGRGGVVGWFLDRTRVGRWIVYRQAERQVRRRTGGHYPAPLAAITAIRTGMERGMRDGLRVEAREFGRLAVSEVSRELVRIFFATTSLKKDDGVPRGTGTPRTVTRLGVVGAGFMGAGIAGTAVTTAGVEVRLKDADLSRVGKGMHAALEQVNKRMARRRITRHEHMRLTALISGAADFGGFANMDLVIEAVFEDLEIKRGVVADLEAVLGTGALIATNTSTIPISRIAEGARHPERILGMHFFSPVDRMPLLEVIPGPDTGPDAIVTAVRFGRRMGKTVIVVADHPGFWVNRILSPYLNEAGHLLAEGVRIEQMDRVMTAWGFPVGPMTLLDEVGFDVGLKAGAVMHDAFGARLAPSPILERLVADGRMGRKNGRGLYRYSRGRKAGVDDSAYRVLGVSPQASADPRRVEERLLYLMLNEAALACAEGVVRSPRDGDIGAIFGIGFPPFRGGPLRLIDMLGAARIVEALDRLAEAHGPRFTPSDSLRDMARTNTRFYPE